MRNKMNKFLQIIKNIFQKADAKHIIMLSSGVLLGQVIAMLLQPIATRLYSPKPLDVCRLWCHLAPCLLQLQLYNIIFQLSIHQTKMSILCVS